MLYTSEVYLILIRKYWIINIKYTSLCLLHDFIEGQVMEVKVVGRRRKTQVLDGLRNRRSYWGLKEEDEDRSR